MRFRWATYAATSLALAALVGCAESGDPSSGAPAPSDRSTAYKLYTLDEGVEPSSEDGPALDPYKRHLRKLKRGCTQTEAELGDLALSATEIVNEQTTLAEPYKIVHLLEPAAAGAGTEPVDCTELFAFVGFGLLAQE